jgi:hypothetical protein
MGNNGILPSLVLLPKELLLRQHTFTEQFAKKALGKKGKTRVQILSLLLKHFVILTTKPCLSPGFSFFYFVVRKVRGEL